MGSDSISSGAAMSICGTPPGGSITIVPGAFADLNVIDWERLHLPPPVYAYDFPGGAGRYVQHATGYDATLVNGEVFMDHGQHTGAFAGTLLKNSGVI